MFLEHFRVSLVTVTPSLPQDTGRPSCQSDLFWESGNGRKEMCCWCLFRPVNERVYVNSALLLYAVSKIPQLISLVSSELRCDLFDLGTAVSVVPLRYCFY